MTAYLPACRLHGFPEAVSFEKEPLEQRPYLVPAHGQFPRRGFVFIKQSGEVPAGYADYSAERFLVLRDVEVDAIDLVNDGIILDEDGADPFKVLGFQVMDFVRLAQQEPVKERFLSVIKPAQFPDTGGDIIPQR